MSNLFCLHSKKSTLTGKNLPALGMDTPSGETIMSKLFECLVKRSVL